MRTKHAKALARTGLSQVALAKLCGLSRQGIRKCLAANRPPKNPLAAAPYLKALGLEVAK
jgi:hypothetical protein